MPALNSLLGDSASYGVSDCPKVAARLIIWLAGL
jgi:hypothetical protein